MMSFLKECCKRIKQDCLARGIAARCEKTAEYEAERKEEVNPLEDLEDMVTEEKKRELQEVGPSESNNSSLVVSILALIVSAATLIFSISSNNKTNRLTERINSKEFQMSQSMKNDLVELVAALRSIDDKAALSKRVWREIDFSNELRLLNDIQTRPGYLVFLYLLNNGSDRFEVEDGLKTLTEDYFVSRKASMTDIRQQAERIMKVIEYHPNLTGVDAMDFDTMLQFLLKARNYDAVEESDVLREHECRRKDFLEKLMREGFEDPNIRYYYYTFIVSDSALANQARQAGAFPIVYDSTSNLGLFEQKEVWEQSLWQCLENEYPVKYHEFLISR